MTIGTSYNFTETNIKNKSEMLAILSSGKKLHPDNPFRVFSSRTITYDSDELVLDASVSAGEISTKIKPLAILEITVTGEDAQHWTFQQR